MTGWNLPPGCTVGDIDRAAGVDGPCACCGRYVDHCICPECPRCSAIGDPGCYDICGLTYSQAQIDGVAEMERRLADEAEAERRLYEAETNGDLP